MGVNFRWLEDVHVEYEQRNVIVKAAIDGG